MTLQPGEMIEGKYRIVRLLGEGGMGSVYEGENARIHRKVAIKVLHAAVAAKADVVQRFEREAQAAGRIGSEHIVEVLDLGSLPSGERFMVMEYLEGESLGDRIKRRKRLSPQECAPVIHQLLEGLASAHEAGIVHRDLKPDNVYLASGRKSQRDFVKVLDFGVSKFSALDSDMSMTKTGAVMGTPYYMSPEQARGAKVDHRSDLYSVGVVMYQAITGRLPFKAETFNELVFKIALESPEPAEVVVPGLDPGFASIITRAMTREADLRFQTAREFQATIAQWMMTSPPIDLGRTDPSLLGTGPRPSAPPGLGGSIPPATPSHPGLAGSNAGLQRSNASLAASKPGLGASAPGLGASGAGMGQSSPLLAGSQTGLAVTAPQPRRGGAMIAAALGVVLAVGAFGAYKLMGGGGRGHDGTGAAAPPADPQAAMTPPEVAQTAAPSADPAPSAAAAADTAPSAAATAVTAPAAAPPRPTYGGRTTVAQPPPPPRRGSQPPPKPTGRTIGSEL